MNTQTIWEALSKCQHQIAEILPIHGGRFDARLRQEAKFAEKLQIRMSERDSWRIPAANWLKLEQLGRDLDTCNAKKMAEEQAAATSQKKLSQISRQWQEMTDLARGRKPQPGGIGSISTITVDWSGGSNTGSTSA